MGGMRETPQVAAVHSQTVAAGVSASLMVAPHTEMVAASADFQRQAGAKARICLATGDQISDDTLDGDAATPQAY